MLVLSCVHSASLHSILLLHPHRQHRPCFCFGFSLSYSLSFLCGFFPCPCLCLLCLLPFSHTLFCCLSICSVLFRSFALFPLFLFLQSYLFASSLLSSLPPFSLLENESFLTDMQQHLTDLEQERQARHTDKEELSARAREAEAEREQLQVRISLLCFVVNVLMLHGTYCYLRITRGFKRKEGYVQFMLTPCPFALTLFFLPCFSCLLFPALFAELSASFLLSLTHCPISFTFQFPNSAQD